MKHKTSKSGSRSVICHRRRLSRRLAATVVTTALSLSSLAVLTASSVGAVEAPTVKNFEVGEVLATRGRLGVSYEAHGTTTDVKFELISVESFNKLEASKEKPLWMTVREVNQPPEGGGLYNAASAEATGLQAGTKYYGRTTLSNGQETRTKPIEFETLKAGAPEFERSAELCNGGKYFEPSSDYICGEAGATVAEFGFRVYAAARDTHWHVEYAESEEVVKKGEGSRPEGAEGTITAAEEEASYVGHIADLKPEHTYYLRVVAENEAGTTTPIVDFHTDAKPIALTGQSSSFTDTSVRLSGNALTHEQETHWRFEYAASPEALAKCPNGAKAESCDEVILGPEGVIPAAIGDNNYHRVEADLTGLSKKSTYYFRLFAENVYGDYAALSYGGFETAGAPDTTTFGVHAIHGEAVRFLGSTSQSVKTGDATHYEFEYLTKKAYEESGDEQPTRVGSGVLDGGVTQEVDEEVSGHRIVLFLPVSETVGIDAPGLQNGESYVYRLVARDGEGTSVGAWQTLTIPAVSVEASGPCPNEALRTGASGALPSCRAYEQVTLPDKQGAMDMFTWSPGGEQDNAWVGEDGEHLLFTSAFNKFGANTGVFDGAYFFARGNEGYWKLVSATPQPETGFNEYEFLAQGLYNRDFTMIGFRSAWQTETSKSTSQILKFGPPGGPYTGLPPMKSDGGISTGNKWAGASEDFRVLVLQTIDRKWCSTHATGTESGEDLYEYADGECRQLNVDSQGKTIGKCGASLVRGYQGKAEDAGVHAVSDDGARIFFKAAPAGSAGCPSEEELNVGGPGSHLYMRLNGTATRDIGPYGYVGATADGTKVLLTERDQAGAGYEFLLYETETGTTTRLFSVPTAIDGPLPGRPFVSEGADVIYLESQASLVAGAPSHPRGSGATDLYRYDVATKTLSFAFVISQELSGFTTNFAGPFLSPDGRFFYWRSTGNPGIPHPEKHLDVAGKIDNGGAPQLYRYDSAEGSVECVSCASPYDPEPLLEASTESADLQTLDNSVNGVPRIRIASDDGGRVFFDTPAALAPQDINGERAREEGKCTDCEAPKGSTSFDVYEWRRPGLDGCARVQGCIALISGGREGVRNKLIGTTPSGRDVFFATHEPLVAQDTDTAGDIYDARIGGGESPPPLLPPPCEGDACTSPVPAPLDSTPASWSFSGPGNPGKSGTKPGLKRCGKHICKRKRPHRAGHAGKRGRRRHRSRARGGAK